MTVFITGILVIAIIYVLVKPGSSGTAVITSVTTFISGLISMATGGGSLNATPATATPVTPPSGNLVGGTAPSTGPLLAADTTGGPPQTGIG